MPNYQLSPEKVQQARQERHDRKTSVRALAKKYGVAHTSMSRALRGVTYPHAGGPLDPSKSFHCLNAQEVVAARKMRQEFQTPVADLALMYDVTKSSMRRILCGISYKDVGGPIEPGYGARLGERDSREKERSQCAGSFSTSQGEGSKQLEPSEH